MTTSTRRGWALHLLFWAISYVILIITFSREYDTTQANHAYTLLFHLPIVLVVYGNLWSFNKYFLKKKILPYVLSFCLLLAFGIMLHFLVFERLSLLLFPGYYFISYYTAIEIGVFVLTYLGLTFLLFLSTNWFSLRERQLQLEKENNAVRLHALRSQINPHFLFNSLNNIYSLAKEKQGQASQYILKLSESLRYMLYDADSEYVSLEDELEHLKNYFELEKLRISDKTMVQFRVKGDPSGIPVAPLVFTPIIENAFKYVHAEAPVIDAQIVVDRSEITFNCKNNYSDGKARHQGGLGLKNVKERLALLYPQQHVINIAQDDDFFSIFIQIELP
ncbi:MAG: histidine kinase [Saprospiraceae bacterium]|nr:histidine kinase [Saprospiraceae bacterium]